jgi:hypothetical protein
MSNNSGSLALKAVGWLIVAFVALFIAKLVIGAFFSALSLAFTLALILIIGYAVIWVVRKL